MKEKIMLYIIIIAVLLLLNYHHLPEKTWKPLKWLFTTIWIPVKKLDKYLFETSTEVKEIKEK